MKDEQNKPQYPILRTSVIKCCATCGYYIQSDGDVYCGLMAIMAKLDPFDEDEVFGSIEYGSIFLHKVEDQGVGFQKVCDKWDDFGKRLPTVEENS